MPIITLDTSKMSHVDNNMMTAEQDGLLIIAIDTSKSLGVSEKGKYECVAKGGSYWTQFTENFSGKLWIGRKVSG